MFIGQIILDVLDKSNKKQKWLTFHKSEMWKEVERWTPSLQALYREYHTSQGFSSNPEARNPCLAAAITCRRKEDEGRSKCINNVWSNESFSLWCFLHIISSYRLAWSPVKYRLFMIMKIPLIVMSKQKGVSLDGHSNTAAGRDLGIFYLQRPSDNSLIKIYVKIKWLY